MRRINERYAREAYDANGILTKFRLEYPDNFNFGYDVVDDIAVNDPDRRAMVWCNPAGEERIFTFADIKKYSDKTALYLRSLGIGVTVLRRRERERFDAALADADCAILSYWTGRTLRDRDGSWNTLHTVSVQRGFAGVELCNCTSDWPAPHSARSIADFLEREGGEPVCLFALKTVDKHGG